MVLIIFEIILDLSTAYIGSLGLRLKLANLSKLVSPLNYWTQHPNVKGGLSLKTDNAILRMKYSLGISLPSMVTGKIEKFLNFGLFVMNLTHYAMVYICLVIYPRYEMSNCLFEATLQQIEEKCNCTPVRNPF